MNNECNGFVVTFENPLSEENTHLYKLLFLAIRPVCSVDLIEEESDVSAFCVKQQIKFELRKKLFALLDDK